MKNFLKKCIVSIIIVFFTWIISDFLIIQLSKSPDGCNTDFGYIETGIPLIICTIVICTLLIIFTIKRHSND